MKVDYGEHVDGQMQRVTQRRADTDTETVLPENQMMRLYKFISSFPSDTFPINTCERKKASDVQSETVNLQ